MARIVLDPVTRLNGPLRVEVDVQNGLVAEAMVSGTMFRGIESVLEGRDPRDAWLLAQRICGSDSGVHALASVRAVEAALGAKIPRNARLVRNILAGSQLVASHAAGFFLRSAPDWADLVAGASADAAATSAIARSISAAPKSSVVYFQAVRERLATFVATGQPGMFATGAAPGPDYRLSPAADLLIGAHYLEALDWRRSMTRLQTYLGGKSPHPGTFVLGGMALAAPWGGPARATTGEHPSRPQSSAPAALSPRGLAAIGSLIAEARTFVDQVYLPDVLLLARTYRDAASTGAGIGTFLSFGEFPEDDTDAPALLLPRGRIMDRDLAQADTVDQSGVAETIGHSHYTDERGDADLRLPLDERAIAHYQGPPAPVTSLDGFPRYSWVKAPRYFDDPMEVGPAARMALIVVRGGDNAALVTRTLGEVGLGPDALFSTMGRMLARAVEARIVADRLGGWLTELTANLASGDLAFADLSAWDPGQWPADADGWSLGESAGGAVGHWVRIRDRRIATYQVVDGSTWNLSPRDGRGRPGALEHALVGTPVPEPGSTVEILRAIHAFDPCPACAVH